MRAAAINHQPKRFWQTVCRVIGARECGEMSQPLTFAAGGIVQMCVLPFVVGELIVIAVLITFPKIALRLLWKMP